MTPDRLTQPAVMTPSGALQRLATASIKLSAHRQLTTDCAQLLAALESGGLVPMAGYRALHTEIQECLDVAQQQLIALAAADDTAALTELEARLDDVVWGVAATVLPELQARKQDQDRQVQDAEALLQTRENQVATLALELDDARIAGAPFTALEAELYAARSRLAALKSALNGRLYGELATLCPPAGEAVDRLQQRVEQARAQMSRVKPLVKQADLLIVQSARADGDFEYRVVLRCADHSRTRGIHIIQDVRLLTCSDRDWLKAQLGDLTAAAYRKLSPLPAAEVPPRPLARRLRLVGSFLRRMVIPEQMVEILSSQPWSFNITTNDLDLPWELLCFGDDDGPGDDDDYGDGADARDGGAQDRDARGEAAPVLPDAKQVFCLGQAISRLPLGEAFPRSEAPQRPRAARRRRMLLIHADPSGTLTAAAGEVAAIAAALGSKLDITALPPAAATVQNLNALLTESSWDLIHYAGHAQFDSADAAHSGLVLTGGLFPAHKILRLSRGKSLVFLNACESAAGAAPVAAASMGSSAAVSGLAAAFLYAGALACVGALWPVVDPSAAALAVTFYDRVLEGDPVGEALRNARLSCWQTDPAGGTWAAYVLYGDPTLRLTEV